MKLLSHAHTNFQRFLEICLFQNRRQKKITEYAFRTEIIQSQDFSPIFFLSTGRTGTKFFTLLLGNSYKLKVFHSPSSLLCNAQSELIAQGKVIYEIYKDLGIHHDYVNKLGAQIFMAARENLLYQTFLHGKAYVETNNRVTFLAPAIKYFIPNAKFVHLYRHPGEFVRSGIRRKYYLAKGSHEVGRIVPVYQDKNYSDWGDFSHIEKVAWLWNETNHFIENFTCTLNKDDYYKFNFNDLSVDTIIKLLKFLQVNDIRKKTISYAISKPVNVQTSGTFPVYSQWPEGDKRKVRNICGELSEKYNYCL